MRVKNSLRYVGIKYQTKNSMISIAALRHNTSQNRNATRFLNITVLNMFSYRVYHYTGQTDMASSVFKNM